HGSARREGIRAEDGAPDAHAACLRFGPGTPRGEIDRREALRCRGKSPRLARTPEVSTRNSNSPIRPEKCQTLSVLFPLPCSLSPVPYSPCPAPAPCSLFPVPCSLFPLACSLFPLPCSLFPVPYSLPFAPPPQTMPANQIRDLPTTRPGTSQRQLPSGRRFAQKHRAPRPSVGRSAAK